MVKQSIKRSKEKGMAMFVALMLVLLLSVIGISLAFVAQTGTWSSLNYRVMTQERYGAEAGMYAAAYYLMNTYTAPSTSGTDLLTNYTMTTSPVQYNGHPVVLSTTSSAANYPVAAVETAFQSAAHGSLTAGASTLNYTASATLLAMNQVTTSSGPVTVQTWSITADDPITGIRTGEEEVTGVLERQVSWGSVPAPGYGVFATGTGCASLNLSGNPLIASYSSTAPLVSGAITVNNWGGNVGTNGNLTAAGSSTVDGTLSTPRAGIMTGHKAACSGAAVNAGDYTGTSTVTGCGTAGPVSGQTSCTSTPVQLSQNITYTTPTMPGSQPTFNTQAAITMGFGITCAQLNISAGCSGAAGALTLTPPFSITCGSSCGSGIQPSCGTNCTQANVTSLPALNVSSTNTITINPGGGTITIAGLTQSNGGQITINATSAMTVNTTSLTTSGSQSLIINNAAATTLNVWGDSSGNGVNLGSGTALSMSGSHVVTMNINSTTTAPFTASGAWSNTNSTGVPTPSMFQIEYGGTSAMNVEAGSAAAAAIYAPNAPVNIVGGSTFFGSIVGTVVSDTNGANIYYDRQMGGSPNASQIATVGNFMMDSFSWSRF